MSMKKIWQKLLAFGKRKEGLYFFLASFLGLGMVFINPPFAGVPDEHAHYLKASAVAAGYWRCTGSDQISQSNLALADRIKPIDVAGAKDQKVPLGVLKKEFFTQPDLSKKTVGNVICGAPTTAYLPQAAGIFLGEKLGLSSLAGFYLARILSLFVAVLITFWAIKLLPFGRNILLVIALLPMTLQQYASLNYDALHIPLSFLFFVLVLHLAFSEKKKISRGEIALLVALAFFGLNIKGAFLLSLLVFLIPKEKFFNAKANWLAKGLVAAAGFSGLLFNRKGFVDPSGGFPANVNPAEQADYVLGHPLAFLNSVFLTFYDKLGFFVETFLIKPGWLRISLPYLFYVLLICGLVLLIKNTDEEEKALEKVKKNQRVWLFLVFLANFVLVFLALYLGWSRVGAEKVGGVQGRYFLPFIPLLIFAFYGAKINLKFDFLKKHNRAFLTGFFLLMFFWFFWFIYGYYYRADFRSEGNVSDRMATTEEVKNAEVVSFEKQVQQKFFQEKGDLIGIKVYFSKKILFGEYTFSVRDKDCQEVLREKKFETKGRKSSSVEWKFALIEEKEKDKEFCFVISGGAGNFNDVKVMPLNEGRQENIVLDGEKKERTLLFDLIYND